MNTVDDHKAVLALTTRLGDQTRPSLSPTRWHRFSVALGDANLTPGDIFAQDFDPRELLGVPDDIALAVIELTASASVATVAAADLTDRGVWAKTIGSEDYPEILATRLGKNAPPTIFGVGNASLLDGEAIGIVGSRNVDHVGAGVAAEVAKEATRLNRAVVSGGARGVDQLAMNAAYSVGGSVVGVLADSLLGRIRNSEILSAIESGSTCLITQQHPSAGFSPGSAMGRNKLIYGLSALTVVIATDEGKGGTWTGAAEALKNDHCRVVVWRGPGEGPGNEKLESLGATPIRESNQLMELLETPPAPQPVQLGLLDLV